TALPSVPRPTGRTAAGTTAWCTLCRRLGLPRLAFRVKMGKLLYLWCRNRLALATVVTSLGVILQFDHRPRDGLLNLARCFTTPLIHLHMPTPQPANVGSPSVAKHKNSSQFVGFQIANQEYAFRIEQIQEIVILDQVTKTPQVPSYVEGVSN